MIVRFSVALANTHELTSLPALGTPTIGTLVGDRNDWSPATTTAWQRLGVGLVAPSPYRSGARSAPALQRRAQSGAVPDRHRLRPTGRALRCQEGVGTPPPTCAQSAGSRAVLMHTTAVQLNVDLGHPPRHLARLVA